MITWCPFAYWNTRSLCHSEFDCYQFLLTILILLVFISGAGSLAVFHFSYIAHTTVTSWQNDISLVLLWLLVSLSRAPSQLLTLPILSTAPHSMLFIVCNALTVTSYILGKFGQRLGDCIKDHLYDICNNNLSKSVACNSNSSNHSVLLHLVYL